MISLRIDSGKDLVLELTFRRGVRINQFVEYKVFEGKKLLGIVYRHDNFDDVTVCRMALDLYHDWKSKNKGDGNEEITAED